MSVRVVEVERDPAAVETRWRETLERLPRYSFFQTPDWAQILVDSACGFIPRHAVIRYSDGAEAVLPLLASPKRFGFMKLESLPWGAYGGLLTQSPLSSDHYQAAMQAVTSWRSPVCEIVQNPLDEQFEPCAIHRQTGLLALPDSIEALWQGFQSRNRTSIRRAREAGVVCQRRNDKTAVESLERLYRQAVDEIWSGVETVPVGFFQALHEKIETNENFAVWTAELDGAVYAADLVLYGKGEAQYFIGAANRDAPIQYMPRALMAAILEDACEQKLKWFNFGGSAGQEGVERFKRHFGAESKLYSCYRYRWLLG